VTENHGYGTMIETIDSTPKFIRHWTAQIRLMKLATPVCILLEIHKPLSFVIGQFFIVAQPMLNMFLPNYTTDNIITLLSNRNYLNQLIEQLEREAKDQA